MPEINKILYLMVERVKIIRNKGGGGGADVPLFKTTLLNQ